MQVEVDNTGRTYLTDELVGVIKEIKTEVRGTTKNGTDWTRGGVVIECKTDPDGPSVRLFLTIWGDEMVEVVNNIGLNKNVRVKLKIESREYYDSYRHNVTLEDINGLDEATTYLYKKKGGSK